MAYHIALVINKSNKSVAITNPAHEADSKLVLPGADYVPGKNILVNSMSGNPSYQQAAPVANAFYTCSQSWVFWDNTNSAINGVGENGGEIYFNGHAGDLQVVVNADGSLSISPM
jgi:hypothetical protein